MSNEFDPHWPHGHQTRDGRKARIVCTDADCSFPIVGLVSDPDGRESIRSFTKDGRLDRVQIFPGDLINAPAPKAHGYDAWVNVYFDDEIGLTFFAVEGEDVARKALPGRGTFHLALRNNRIVDITDGENDGKAELIEALRKIASSIDTKFESGSITYVHDVGHFNDLLRCVRIAQDAISKHGGEKP